MKTHETMSYTLKKNSAFEVGSPIDLNPIENLWNEFDKCVQDYKYLYTEKLQEECKKTYHR